MPTRPRDGGSAKSANDCRRVMADTATVRCHECRVELAADSPALRLELTYDDELIAYCEACWQREFGVAAPGDESETPPRHHPDTTSTAFDGRYGKDDPLG